jgi:hypothetical protein
MTPQAASGAISRIEREAQSLSLDENRHLNAHLAATSSARAGVVEANIRFKRVVITFHNLRANSKVHLSLRHDRDGRWSEGISGGGLVGVSLSSNRDPTMYIRNFFINPREMVLQTYRNSLEIEVQIYVRTSLNFIQGRVDLPPGASVTLQSASDRTTLIGLSAFALDLD